MSLRGSRPVCEDAPVGARRSGLQPAPEDGAAAPATRKVRVLFVNDTARNGGPGRSLYYLLKFLDPAVVHRAVVLPREGVIATLLSSGGVTDELFYEPNLVENPVEPWDRAMVRADFDAPWALRAVRLAGNIVRGGWSVARLTSLVKRGRFDLVYCNGTNADFAGGAVAWTSGVPALWHVRYTSVPRVVAGVHDRLAASEGVRRIVCVSQAAAAQFRSSAHKTRVIHNALDVDEFHPTASRPTLRAELGLDPACVVFGSQGRILRRKGYVEMIRAAALARSQMSARERDLSHFVVLGDTPEDLRPDHLAECRDLVRQLELRGVFTFLGFRRDVRPLVADFDVAVVPSVYQDPLPRSVLEAMALGKPVIAFDVGGVAEMVRHGETGTLVPGPLARANECEGADVPALAREMLRYLRDPQMRARQGTAARARVISEFDGAAHAKKIQNEIVHASGLSR